MYKRFTMMVANILLLLLPLNVFANGEVYPLKSQYPNGVDAVDISLFSNSNIKKPIETGFEKSSEIESLINESQSTQSSISEDSYSGKFALKIQKRDDRIIPVYETEYFQTGYDALGKEEDEDKTVIENISGIRVAMRDKNITVSGNAVANEEVTILIKKGETIAYINQIAADDDGNYMFAFPLKEYGTYQLGVGGSHTKEAVFGDFQLLDPKSIDEESIESTNFSRTYNAKCNFYTLKLKPMKNSETISFYVKVKKLNELGNIEEDYALIKSDSDGDGAYSVGSDLSRGKWQTIQLNIADLDEEFQNGAASGLYMNANQGSQWLIDDISSDYRKNNETKFNLAEFASGNVIYSEGELRFANNKEGKEYNIGSKVVSGGVKISEQLSGIQIDSRLQYASGTNAQQEENKEILYSEPLGNDNCAINNQGEEILCEMVQKPKEREVLPEIESSKEMNIYLKPETETRFRLLLSNTSSSIRTVTIETENESSKSYTLNNPIYTDWFNSDITISSSYDLDDFMDIKAIEYEAIEENSSHDILLDKDGSFTIDLGEFISDDRTNLTYGLSYENADSYASELLLEFFEGSSSKPYYTTKTYINTINGKQIFNNIIPKIRANTKLKITRSTTNKNPAKMRFSGIEIMKLTDNDWNKTMDYVDYEITEKKFTHRENSTYIKSKLAKNIYSEGEKYAVVYPDAEGVVNTGTGNVAAGGASSNISVYRILNLSEESAKGLITSSSGTNIDRGTPVYLHYGLADYVVSGKDKYFALPPNDRVMLISKTSYSDEKSDASPVHYTFVDGLYDGEFVQNEATIIYSNVYDGGSAYKYDLQTKTTQKLTSDRLICGSPDGTHLLLKDNNEKYYILNILTNEKEETPLSGSYRDCFFNAKNELFVVNNSLSYYSAGELHAIVSSISSKAYISHDFDSTGEYLFWTEDKGVKLYKNTNGIWNEIKSFSIEYIPRKSVLSNDISTAYIGTGTKTYTIDLNAQTASELFKGDVFEMTDDNMLLFMQSDFFYLYNPVTAEKQKLFNHKFACDFMTYNPETNMVTGIMPNSRVIYHHATSEEPEAKYALSFDGRDNWYAYAGGRWQTVSKSTIPTGEELGLAGMTASVVNSIPASAYEKLNSNNTDVLTVDVAIYMYSDSQKRTPVIENIMVETIEKENIDGLYGIHIEKYNKEDYRQITSLFPVENFGSNAECYYLFYIGNEWLYTYKDNEIVKVNEPANILLSDMSETWIKFKQYGMNAGELRRVPADVLSQLFVNEDYANTEFGVIYVIKTKNEDTSKYAVNFHLGASSDFITDDDIVVELIMNGGAVKIIDSTEFSVTDIENLLSWIESRQNGNGEIFYRLSNANTQHFINYYMINSVSVYSGEEYRANN